MKKANTDLSVFKANLTQQQRKIANTVDNTYLNINDEAADRQGVDKVCREARQNAFPAVCVRPEQITRARKNLEGSNVKVATVIGFPRAKMSKSQAYMELGNIPVDEKVREAENAVSLGADELDAVINIPAAISENTDKIFDESYRILETVNTPVHQVPVKFIMETGILDHEQKENIADRIMLAKKSLEDKIGFEPSVTYKTSTGFIYEDGNPDKIFGATEQDVKFLIEKAKGAGIKVKASGGIKTPEQAQRMIELGVDRIGTSGGAGLVG